MTRRRKPKDWLVALGSIFLLAACNLLPETGGKMTTLEVLDESAQVLRDQFNRDEGKVRLLFVIDPRCATCLRGLADLDRDLLSSLPASVAVYLVHLPVIGGRAEDVPAAASLTGYSGTRHYWDPRGSFGRRMGEILPLRRGGEPVFAWDVWMAYGPEAVWGWTPPQPRLLMHQLPYLDAAAPATEFDSGRFADRVRALVAGPGTRR
jgi:hypothetical protein